MAAPPENKESNTFSVTIDDWGSIQDEFISPVYRINGYPWHLRLARWPDGHNVFSLFLICDKSCEAELWKCTATIKMTQTGNNVQFFERSFISWDERSHKLYLGNCSTLPNGHKVQIEITTKEDGNSWRLCPDVNLRTYDCILVCGDNKEKVHVNKKSLASQSSYFESLFHGDFKEKDMNEIRIGDIDGEEFFNIIKILYRIDGAYLSDQNVARVAELSDRFVLKIVGDKAASYLLSSSSSLSILDTIFIAGQCNLSFLMENILPRFTEADVIELSNSAEFDLLSHDTLRVLFKKGNTSFMSTGRMNRMDSDIPDGCNPYKNEPNIISMVIKDWEYNQMEQISSVYRINGFPWRIRIKRRFHDYDEDYRYDVYVICDKSIEADLWKCTANISLDLIERRWVPGQRGFIFATFASWDKNSHCYHHMPIRGESLLKVTIGTDDDGERYCRRPSLDPLEPRDGILVFEDPEKKIEVNKKSLASLSPYFDRLFFENFKEKDMKKIPIGDVQYEEFASFMAVLYGECDVIPSLNIDTVLRMLQLADRFEIMSVGDKVVSFLLSSSSSSFSLPKKLLIADQCTHPFLKDTLIPQFNSNDQLKELSESPEWEQLSKETLRVLFKKFCICNNFNDYMPSMPITLVVITQN